eukprot:gene27043-32571_t
MLHGSNRPSSRTGHNRLNSAVKRSPAFALNLCNLTVLSLTATSKRFILVGKQPFAPGCALGYNQKYGGAGSADSGTGLFGVTYETGVDKVLTTAKEPAAPNGQGRSGQAVPIVVVRAADAAKINDRLSAIGTGKAKSSVSVTPFAAGRMTEILVTSGTRVEAGDVIARLDSEAESIAADKARTMLKDAQTKLKRAENLSATNTVSAVQVSDAGLAVDNAGLDVREAELALDRRAVKAPIGGIVGILPVSAGNYITTTTQIATI